MSELLNSGMVGFAKSNNLSSEQIVTNWTQSGLLEGLTGATKTKVALVMEETAQIMLSFRDYANISYETIVFPIIRRVISGIERGDYDFVFPGKPKPNVIPQTYDEVKDGLIDLIDGKVILSQVSRLWPLSLEFFYKIYDDKEVDIEAEAAAFVAERIEHLYLIQFRNKRIIKVDDKYVSVNHPLSDSSI
jgi:hypothetical protein